MTPAGDPLHRICNDADTVKDRAAIELDAAQEIDKKPAMQAAEVNRAGRRSGVAPCSPVHH
jgi:hypothetical protein